MGAECVGCWLLLVLTTAAEAAAAAEEVAANDRERTKCGSTIFLNGIKTHRQRAPYRGIETDRSWITAHKHIRFISNRSNEQR